jgi:hypothetical protein
MTTLHPATERIAFQLNSPLAKKLVALCADTLAWVEETRKSHLVDGKIVIATPDRIRDVTDYIKTTFVSRLVTICAQQLNLSIVVYIDSATDYGNSAMFAFYVDVMKTKDFDRLLRANALYSGVAAYADTPFDASLFIKLASNIDLEKSKLFKKTKDYLCCCFIQPANFLGPELFQGSVFLTAEEQAAIILHELGHALTILEHMGDLYYRADIATNSITYLDTKASDKTVLQVVETLEKHTPTDAPDYETALSAVKANVSHCHPVVAGIAFFFFTGAVLSYIAWMVGAGVVGGINEGSSKTSDTVVTQSNLSYCERMADEFVSRHGLGKALTSGLLKIGVNKVALREAVSNNLLIKTTILSLATACHFFGMFFFYDDGVYDPLWLRSDHLLQNNMVVFKDDTLSPALRTHFLAETKELITLVETYKKSKGFKLKSLFWGTIMRILSRGSVVDGFRTANLSNDYDKLQLMTNGLIKNKLFMHAARLKNL